MNKFNSTSVNILKMNYRIKKLPFPRTSVPQVQYFSSGNSKGDQSNSSRMLQYQDKLPSLPVPLLKNTCEKYLKSIAPLCKAAEFKKNQELIGELLAKGGLGEQLQTRLQEHAASQNKIGKSWLEDWWLDGAYMGYRDPVVIYVNYFYVFNDLFDLNKTPKANTKVAANLIQASLNFRQEILNGTLEPEYLGKTPLDMSQYTNLFNACRIPAIPNDTYKTWDPVKNRHVAVVRNNQFFVFDVVNQDGTFLSTASIQSQLEKIIAAAGNKKGIPLGALTTENRDTWTHIRDSLVKQGQNQQQLEKLESAILLLCLDTEKPSTRDQASRLSWHGDGRNRFFDKSIQFIVFDNGKAGFNAEHSSMDGSVTTRLCDSVLTKLKNGKIDHGSSSASNLPDPVKLVFNLDSKIQSDIKQAEKNFDKLIGDHNLHVQPFLGYGRNAIKTFGFSPDAYVQMAIQLAYRIVHGESRPTYETGMTRQFLHGRTETIRTVSKESVAWINAMGSDSIPAATKYSLLQNACEAHSKYSKDAVNGLGVDRHFLGLQKVLNAKEAKPALFSDPIFTKSKHWYVSTSQLSSELFDGYGWGEVVPDGYGIAYMIKEKALFFNVTSTKAMKTKEIHKALETALKSMQNVCETGAIKKSKL